MKEKFYISTAIAYTSGKPHIGNTYEIVLSDAIARFKRLKGYDVYFQTGTDEHGEKIELKAKEAGITPQEFVDNVSGEIKNIWDIMNTSYDKFVRTTDESHEKVVQHIFKYMYDKGDIYKGEYKGLYCTPCESFWTESQLLDGKCPDCGRDVEEKCEEAYFFKLSKYQDRLIEYINNNPDFIQPESRKNEMIQNFLKVGLQDLCVSRTSFTWGVPVEEDKKHVVYVWLDALVNYISALGYLQDDNSKFKEFWEDEDCEIVHVIGADITRFHAIYWPMFLESLGLREPNRLFVHGLLMMKDGKMSKSRGNAISAYPLIDRYGVDALRYYLVEEIPFGQDGVFTPEQFVMRINQDLANNLGNLLNRTVSMIDKYFNGIIPAYEKGVGPFDTDLEQMEENTISKYELLVDDLKVTEAYAEVMNLVSRANKYIEENAPWALAKD